MRPATRGCLARDCIEERRSRAGASLALPGAVNHVGSSVRSRLAVAIVAPSLDILGGQAVQADRLLRSWREDPDVCAWLVPINPRAPGPLALAQRVKYARTVVTQAAYWPSLLRGLR